MISRQRLSASGRFSYVLTMPLGIKKLKLRKLEREMRRDWGEERKQKTFLPYSFSIDCEQSLSFPRVARVAIYEGRARAARSEVRRKRKKKGFFPASPHSLLVSFPNLHNINSSARRGFQEQKPFQPRSQVFSGRRKTLETRFSPFRARRSRHIREGYT